MKCRKAALSLGVSVAALGLGSIAAAQVDVIIVTAQKRAESLQDVPISVTALNEEQLENSGVRDIKDLINITPGLMVTSTSNEASTTARIRGVGTVGDNPGLESSVGVFIDGVYRNRNGVGFGDLGEIERVEVLRGPQGTLFGKNTSAGVLNIITAAPEYNPGAGFEVSYGNFDFYKVSGYVTGGNAEENAAFRLYAAKSERDGFQSVGTGNGPREEDESYTSDYFTLRGQALFEPNDFVDIRLIADYSERDEDCCTAVQLVTNPAIVGALRAVNGGMDAVLPEPDPEERFTLSNRSTAQQTQDWGFSAQLDWEFEAGTLTSITAYREFDTNNAQDVDFSAADILYRNLDENGAFFETFTQEIRFAGQTDKIDWMVGGFYADEDLTRLDAIRFGSAYAPYVNLLVSSSPALAGLTGGVPSPTFLQDTINNLTPLGPLYDDNIYPLGAGMNGDVFNQAGETFAIFTHDTYRFTPDTALTLGLRWTKEDKDLTSEFRQIPSSGCDFFTIPNPALGGATGQQALAGTPLEPAFAAIAPTYCLYWADARYEDNPYDFSRSDEEFSGTVRLSHDFTTDVLGYVSYSRGFKAGGFNLDRDPLVLDGTNEDTSFEPEFIDAYEAGLKTLLMQGQLVLNAAAFWQEIEDFQLNSFLGTRFVVENIEDARVAGIESDFIFEPADIDGLSITGGAAYIDSEYGDDIPQENLAGEQLTLSPEFMGNLAITYERPLMEGYGGLFHLEGRYVSDYNTGSDLDPEKEEDGFGLVNARIGVVPDDGNWRVELWAKNIFDEYYNQVAFDAPLQEGGFNAFPGQPRTYGVTVRADF